MRTVLLFLVFALVVHATEELPKPGDYPAEISPLDQSAKAKVPNVHNGSRCIRDLVYDRPELPDFADHFSFWIDGCGTACAEFCIVDRRNGQVYPGFVFSGGPEFTFSRTSRLVGVKHTDGMYADDDELYLDWYAWEDQRFRFIGRWVSTVGAERRKKPDWRRHVLLDPNPPTWTELDQGNPTASSGQTR